MEVLIRKGGQIELPEIILTQLGLTFEEIPGYAFTEYKELYDNKAK